MSPESFKRKLTAILSADVKGYSRMMGENEAETVKTLTAYRKIMGELIQQHRGRVIDSPGDNMLAEFGSVVDAVQCSVAAQNEFKARNAELPENRRMVFRIGVNLGDVIEEEGRIYGDGVNIAARLEALADPGGICISKTAFDHIESKLPLGYQFLGEQTVKNIAKPVGAYKVLMEPRILPVEQRKKARGVTFWKRKPVLLGALVVLVMVIGVAVWNFYWRVPKIEPATKKKMAFPLPDKPSIAVLPLANMSGDPKQEFLCDGITENIITALSKVPKLFVIARNSTFTYKGKPVKVKQVGEELGVQYVLEGSIQKSADRIRITAQLIDVLNGYHIWAERYDRDLRDLFALQDEITIKIISALQVKLTGGETAQIVARSTQNLQAYLKVLEAREAFYTITKEGFAQARRLCEEAIALDPEYAGAYLYLGSANFMDVVLGSSKSPEESLKHAFETIKKAIALDESEPSAHSVMGILYSMTKQYDKGISECERAITLAPNSSTANIWMATVLFYAGRHEEAVRYAEQALRLDPLPVGWYFRGLGNAYFGAGRYEEAIAAHKKALERAPDDIVTHLALTTAYSWAGRLENARAQAAEVLRINPKYSVEQAEKRSIFKYQADTARFYDGLRKAGLPQKPPLPLPAKPSIAVLPFLNMSDDPQQEYFSDGMTEDLITDLSKISGLLIIARNSTFAYKGKSINVQQISRELGVKYVLEGSVRRAGDQLRINAQLVDATTGQHLWAERYDGSRNEVFALQDKINQKIVAALALKLTEGEKSKVAQKWTHNPAAYDEYLKGRKHASKLTADDCDKAEVCYKKALDLDPKFSQARAALASLYLTKAQFGLGEKKHMVYWENRLLAIHHLREAMKEPTPLAYRLSGDMDLLMRMHNSAISKIEKALSLDPNDPDIHGSLSWALCMVGQPAEAIESAKRAMRMDPINPDRYLYNIGVAQFCLGNMEEAATLLEKVLRANPEQVVAAGPVTAAYAHLGRLQEASAAWETLRQHWGPLMFWLPGVTYYYPFKDRRFTESLSEGLRKAGIPGALCEYIHVSREDQITGDDLRTFLYPSNITGLIPNGDQWSADFAKDGRVTFTSPFIPGGSDKGRTWLEGDKLCFQFQHTYFGMVYCGATFKNPKGTPEGKDDYVRFTDIGLVTFSRAR